MRTLTNHLSVSRRCGNSRPEKREGRDSAFVCPCCWHSRNRKENSLWMCRGRGFGELCEALMGSDSNWMAKQLNERVLVSLVRWGRCKTRTMITERWKYYFPEGIALERSACICLDVQRWWTGPSVRGQNPDQLAQEVLELLVWEDPGSWRLWAVTDTEVGGVLAKGDTTAWFLFKTRRF